MSYYTEQQAPPHLPQAAYPPQQAQAYVAPPPPAGYPTASWEATAANSQQPPFETKSRGDGFWRGCCAALCCCCALDMCF